MTSKLASNTDTPELIRADEMYSSRELHKRLRIGQATWQKMRKKGLPIFRLGKISVVFGEDVIKYCKREAERQAGGD